jgi:hypothetical protein
MRGGMNMIQYSVPKKVFLWTVSSVVLALALSQTVFTYQEQRNPSSELMKDTQFSSTAFTYQGELKDTTGPVNGIYDFQFTLYTTPTGGHEVNSITFEDVVLTNGRFTEELDFGHRVNELWLEIAVRPGSSAEVYTVLSPRQKLTLTPYAIFAQREPWSLIGVAVGLVGDVDKSVTIADEAMANQKPANSANSTAELADKSITSAKGDDGTVTGTEMSLTAAPHGECGLPLPCSSSNSIDVLVGGAFSITHTGRFGSAGHFRINNSSSLGSALEAEITSGNGTAFSARTSGPGRAGDFNIFNFGNINPALEAFTNGTGPALRAITRGTGPAGRFEGNVHVLGNLGIKSSTPQANLHVGGQVAAPGTPGSVDRIVIQPYGHTGGPFKITARDDASNAYFDLKYGSDVLLTILSTGNIGIGRTSPGARLDVEGPIRSGSLDAGPIRSRSGGFQFPDGTIQTTAQLRGPEGPRGPAGPPGPPGPPGINTFAVCLRGVTCIGACTGGTRIVGQSQGPCSVTSQTGGCSYAGSDGVCCVCAP